MTTTLPEYLARVHRLCDGKRSVAHIACVLKLKPDTVKAYATEIEARGVDIIMPWAKRGPSGSAKILALGNGEMTRAEVFAAVGLSRDSFTWAVSDLRKRGHDVRFKPVLSPRKARAVAAITSHLSPECMAWLADLCGNETPMDLMIAKIIIDQWQDETENQKEPNE